MLSGGVKIGTGIMVIIGLVIFYAVFGAVDTEGWDGAVVALVGLMALGMAVAGLLDILGIRLKA